MYYVYVLYSVRLRKRYIGKTKDLRRRVSEHNQNNGHFTGNGIPWKLIYYESFISEADSISEEKFLKSGKGRERLKFLLFNTEKILGEV